MMNLKPLGNFVLLERVRPTSALLDGLSLDDDALFIWKVQEAGEGRYTADGKLIPIPVKAGDEVAIIGQVVPFDPVMYGDGERKLFLVNAEQIVCIVNDRESWHRPSLLVAQGGRVMSGKERQAMHAGAAKAEMVS